MNKVATRLDWAGIGRLVRQIATQAVVEHRFIADDARHDADRQADGAPTESSTGSKR